MKEIVYQASISHSHDEVSKEISTRAPYHVLNKQKQIITHHLLEKRWRKKKDGFHTDRFSTHYTSPTQAYSFLSANNLASFLLNGTQLRG